jgi:hypothetical protein
LPLKKPLPVILILLSIGFFVWHLTTISVNSVPTNQAWLLDKWHLGPLRLLNFVVMGWTISKVLWHLQHWDAVLQPFSLIGRNMLPVFCSQISLSVLLIGIILSHRSAEPFSSILVICQLLAAFLLAHFFEWIKIKLLGAPVERFAGSNRTLAKVKTPSSGASTNQWSALAVATDARAIVNTDCASVCYTSVNCAASTPRQKLSFRE